MKAVIISIRPEWCEKIASGQKTIEVRKTRPKIDTPFKCYIYKTKQFAKCEGYSFDNWISSGKVIGEFICDTIHKYGTKHIYGKYCLPKKIWQMSCLSWEVLDKYADIHDLYCWHISDLVIYDKPRELSDFCTNSSVLSFDNNGKQVYTGMKRPPQSWCYVEELC